MALMSRAPGMARFSAIANARPMTTGTVINEMSHLTLFQIAV